NLRVNDLRLFSFAGKESCMDREGQCSRIGCLSRWRANQRQSYSKAHEVADKPHFHKALLGFGLPMRRYVSVNDGAFRSPILRALDISAQLQLAHLRAPWRKCRSTD